MNPWLNRLHRRMKHGFRGRHYSEECPVIGNNLSSATQDSVVTIICNNDHKTVERGLYTGVKVKILRNEPEEPNIVIAVGDARYVLDRRIARRIKIKTD